MKKILLLILCLTCVFLLNACGNDDKTDSAWVTSASSQNQSAADTTYPFGITPDDRTVIFSISNVTYVYTHDGETVTGHTEYWDMYDQETAAETVAEATENGKPVDKEYKSVTARENYVIVEYNPDYFPIKTYEELMRVFAEQQYAQ